MMSIKIDGMTRDIARARDAFSFMKFGMKGTHEMDHHMLNRFNGFLGEEVVSLAFPELNRADIGESYDFYIGNEKFDVKSKGSKNASDANDFGIVELLEEYTKKDINYYIFVKVFHDHKNAAIMGMISRECFLDRAQYVKPHEPYHGHVSTHGRYILEICDLTDARDMKSIFKAMKR